MDISNIRRNVQVIDEGAWVGDIPNAGNLRLKVRGMNSRLVRDARESKERAVENSDRARDGTLTSSASMRVLGEVLHEAVLLDWENLTDGGNEVKFSQALAKEWLTNPAFEQFADAVVWAARYVDRNSASLDDAAKN